MTYFAYFNTTTKAVSQTLAAVRRAMPNVSVPVDAVKIGVFERYELVQPPVIPPYHKLVELAPRNGKQQWDVVMLDSQSITDINKLAVAASEEERTRLLRSCDWSQLSDCQLSEEQQQQWTAYRQALRELAIHSDISSVQWPQRPV